MSTCRSCGAPIVWARDPGRGKNVPLNERPMTMYELDDGDEDQKAECIPVQVYQNHFATCPDADKWRQQR